MSDTAKGSGLFDSLRRFLSTVLEMGRVRLALLGTEVEFEKRRLFDALIWGALALMCVGCGLVLACGFVILLFWESYRLAAVGVMALLFLGVGVTLMREARWRLRSPAGMFQVSLSEIEQDKTQLQTPPPHAAR